MIFYSPLLPLWIKLMPTNAVDIQLIQLLSRLESSIEGMKGLQQSTNATLATMVEQLIDLRNELNEYEVEAAASRLFRTETEIKQLEAVDKQYLTEIMKLQDAQKLTRETLEDMRTKGTNINTSQKIKAAIEKYKTENPPAPIDLKGFRFSEKAWRNLLIAVVAIVLLWVMIDPASFSGLLMRLAEWLRGV